MIIECTNPECKRMWEYKGVGKFYCTCPQCYRKIKIPKKKGK